ncbi:UDP-N-acetylglucosamine--N-acetylmuramyl-(pentapeptide) pyrophosphoryl-undecaprenol N-acetylglucosamine transferase [Priestia aryabhattai]|uniref:UDP-N-acetylglucosamine--N-acetylmuramyl-(pentapeptide) pyrophosphoryl-undecaprenol N-acetylglucosamine transferase n=1 Tax=Priestia aryabhattai TaxID=412384 RepID=A0AAX6NCX8_PRIAR|nr:UDP-N-acetylglucosamine--N-acetylmuramyl-(pentapeptide) pyrophosphoryl-undecaprenol N-acetylglucosamine transferase [Priestia aryabhattai]MDU9693586.1 UDP-N-acetylglucosamine--N-acetylmuramyl-(pentapeptide) pyrophosphoryl-undecaprenol N-acetylglucosamine transferase [Priestia aryabhattai]
MKDTYKVVITGGGTAGHITPALSIARSLIDNFQTKIYYLGNENFLEKELAHKEGFPFFHIHSQGMEGKNPLDKWKNFIARNSKGIIEAYRHLKNINPDFVVSTGGFVTAPVLAAARLLSIPYFIHEQNTVMGRVNKLFVKNAKEVYYSFEETLGGMSLREGMAYGNPVPVNEAIKPGNSLVVLGGSGGSEFLNQWTLSFAKANPKISIHLQAGRKNVEALEVQKEKGELKNLTIHGFVNIVEMYERAKVVVTRGGTSSLFELANAEIPSIVVPLPNSMDNHQYLNGLHFQQLGGMKVVEQSEQKSGNTLDKVAIEWLNNKDILEEKRKNLQNFTYKNCADKISSDIITVMNELT